MPRSSSIRTSTRLCAEQYPSSRCRCASRLTPVAACSVVDTLQYAMTLSMTRILAAGFAAQVCAFGEFQHLGGDGFPTLPAPGVGAANGRVSGARNTAAFGPEEGGGGGARVRGLHEHMQPSTPTYGKGPRGRLSAQFWEHFRGIRVVVIIAATRPDGVRCGTWARSSMLFAHPRSGCSRRAWRGACAA